MQTSTTVGSGPRGFSQWRSWPGDLRAGMTANVSIFIEERKDVLAVPEAVCMKRRRFLYR